MRQRIGLKTIILSLLISTPCLLMAQGKRPEVLIFGDGIDAYAAALQSAKSRLNTVWINEASSLSAGLDLPSGTIEGHQQLHNGIWADLLAASMASDTRNDSLAAVATNPLNAQLILNAMEEEMKKYPHLLLLTNAQVRSAKKSSSRWEIVLNDRQRFKVRAVVDASADGHIARLAGLPSLTNPLDTDDPLSKAIQSGVLGRTSVAVSNLGKSHPYSVPLGLFIQQAPQGRGGDLRGQNIFFTRNTPLIKELLTGTREDLPLLAHVGQAAGAAAGYVAFFKTTSEKIEVRQAQGELLQYGARLVPYQDVKIQDPNFAAIQRIGLTGLFPGTTDATGNFNFDPTKEVFTGELKPILRALYSRSQIWFEEHTEDQLTLGDLLSLIKYISHRGNELEAQVTRNWQRRYQFAEDFNLQSPATRIQVAVLLDEFCKPFDVRVDLQGKVTR